MARSKVTRWTLAALLVGVGWPAQAQTPTSHDWTGCYAGLNAGWVGASERNTLSPTGAYLTPADFLAPPNVDGTGALPGDVTAVTDHVKTSGSGFAGGGQAGCNKQIDQLLLGIEGDFNGSSLQTNAFASFGPATSSNPAFTVSSHTDSISNRLNWFSTIRARAGFTQTETT